MKKHHLALVLFAVALAASARWPAGATTVTKTYKEYPLTILVTPSPSAMAMGHQKTSDAPRMVSDSNAIAHDVPIEPSAPLGSVAALMPTNAIDRLLAPFMLAQAAPQGHVPVQFNAKADPFGAYFKVIPLLPVINAAYGSNTYPCAVQVFAYYPNAWRVIDWVYGSAPNATGLYPTFNYPATSDLAWLAEGVTTTFKAYYNDGTPGELVFSGTAGQSRTICIDLQLTVPATQPSGYYSTTIQYTLQTT